MPGTAPFTDAMQNLDFELLRKKIAAFCSSEFGKEHVRDLMPSVIFAEVRDELQRVSEMTRLLDADDAPPMRAFPDFRAALYRAKIEASIVSAEDFRDILEGLRISRELRAYLERRSEKLLLLSAYAEQLIEDKLLEFHIDRVVDDEGMVKDGASKDLKRIRKEIMDRTSLLRRRMESILKRVSGDELVQEELVTMRDGRMVLPVKAEFKRQVSGFIHSSSATGQTVYIEPMETLELNNEIRDLQFDEQREIAKILDELTGRLRGAVPALQYTLEAYAELDSIYARARYGISISGIVPDVHLERRLMIQQGRHPILLLHKKWADVIPMDITIGDPETTIIITGPNAGGKSVAMKAAGLIALMTQCGIPVPCAEPTVLPVYEDVLVDIGDEQSIENDLSTFSSHVQRLANIVDAASGKTLILIDEIGTGTDPSEGSALGASILEFLTGRGAHVIATTHHGMLKAVAHQHPQMMNATMEFDLDSLQPTYRFRAGLPGSSYAFEITRRHGMPAHIIDRGREILDTKSDALEQLLVEVERKSQELGTRVRESESSLKKYKDLVTEYEEKMDAVKEEIRVVKSSAREEAESIVQDAHALIERTVKELRESQAHRDAIKASKEGLQQRQDELRAAREAEAPISAAAKESEQTPIRKGDTVRMKDGSDTPGTVLTEPDRGHTVVAFGSLKMRLDVTTLDFVSREGGARERISTVIPKEAPKYDVDVRGMYGDEAVKEVDLFIYQAYSAGMPRVEVIHGKGTGALRKRIHEYLQSLSIVEKFHIADLTQGGDGMTVVYLKTD